MFRNGDSSHSKTARRPFSSPTMHESLEPHSQANNKKLIRAKLSHAPCTQRQVFGIASSIVQREHIAKFTRKLSAVVANNMISENDAMRKLAAFLILENVEVCEQAFRPETLDSARHLANTQVD